MIAPVDSPSSSGGGTGNSTGDTFASVEKASSPELFKSPTYTTLRSLLTNGVSTTCSAVTSELPGVYKSV